METNSQREIIACTGAFCPFKHRCLRYKHYLQMKDQNGRAYDLMNNVPVMLNVEQKPYCDMLLEVTP